MLVVVITIGGVPMPVVGVIDVVAVDDLLVAAARPVHMSVPGVSQVRQRVLVVMPFVRSVRMALVHVVDVSLALSARMPAARPVNVIMIVKLMPCGCHCSSLLWCTASATM